MINSYNQQYSNTFQEYQHVQHQQQVSQSQNLSTGHILFVADLPDDTTEEDLSLFFKDYKFRAAKIIK